MKLCHVFAGTEGGRWVYEQLEALQREHGFESIVVLAKGEGTTVDLCRDAGIPIKTFDFSVFGRRAMWTAPWRILTMALWMRRQRIDVVQSHVLNSTIFARPAAWIADIPVRLTMNPHPLYLQAPALRRFEKATAWMETGVIPSCNLTAELYRGLGVPARLIQPTLYYGPHEARFDPERAEPEGLRAEFGLPSDTPLIGSIAVFYPRQGASSFTVPELHGRYIKGQTDLILAMHEIRAEIPDARLVLVGRGWGAEGHVVDKELRDFVHEEGLDDVVLFAGWRNSTAAVYMDLDVSVQASVSENLGGTIESLLMARPTVATRVGGMVDSVIDGETGLLANPGDPHDLARAILELLRDPERAARLGRAGRDHMLSRFTLTTTVPELAALYRRQRAAAPGAWRPVVSLFRALTAEVCAPFLLARLFGYEMYWRNSLAWRVRHFGHLLRRFPHRLRSIVRTIVHGA